MKVSQQDQRRWFYWGLVLFGGANLAYGMLAMTPELRSWWGMLAYACAFLLGVVPLVRSLRLRTDPAPTDDGE